MPDHVFISDTVWLDLRTLQRTLSRYSPDEPYYGTPLLPSNASPSKLKICAVGASTESVVQEEYFFKMAFGGAGILVSRTLYDAMYENLPLCFDRFTHKVFGGDEMLIRCAAYSTNRKPEETMTEELGLHRKLSGFLATSYTVTVRHLQSSTSRATALASCLPAFPRGSHCITSMAGRSLCVLVASRPP